MAALNTNESFLVRELDWVTRTIIARVEHYFNTSGTTIPVPPDPSGDDGAYASFLRNRGFGLEDRIGLMLTFIPLLRPQNLDCFNIQNSDTGRRFVEFGCREAGEGRVLLPTLETLLFVLAETDLSRRLEYARHFVDHPFFSVHCYRNDALFAGSYSSIILTPSQEIVDQLLYDRPFNPRFSSEFPAARMETGRRWEELVLDESTMVLVDEIRLWVQYEGRIRKEWGMEKILRPGYRALFYGPPGSGKTMTASLLGQVTGRDVYRINLASVVSKYIGETEKNLEKVFNMAEDKDWILFFDEADSLFGKRTGIKDSHDRYANQEVSYLLQRIEEYGGLVVLSTNQKLNIDDAFARRFQSVIRFPMPDADQRKAIWTRSFSPETEFEDAISWDAIARDYELTGGSIMNVVQYASIMAMSRGERIIRHRDILQGVRREYQKEGKIPK